MKTEAVLYLGNGWSSHTKGSAENKHDVVRACMAFLMSATMKGSSFAAGIGAWGLGIFIL